MGNWIFYPDPEPQQRRRFVPLSTPGDQPPRRNVAQAMALVLASWPTGFEYEPVQRRPSQIQSVAVVVNDPPPLACTWLKSVLAWAEQEQPQQRRSIAPQTLTYGDKPPALPLARSPAMLAITHWLPADPQPTQLPRLIDPMTLAVGDAPPRFSNANLFTIIYAWEVAPEPWQRPRKLTPYSVPIPSDPPPPSTKGKIPKAVEIAWAPWDYANWKKTYARPETVPIPPPLFGDSLRFYFTGAVSDGGAQPSQAASLGNYRSNTEADRVGRIYARPLRNISIVQASRANGADGVSGSLTTTSGSFIRYTAPGSGTPGPATSILTGGTVVLSDGADPSKWVRVTRAGTTALSGFGTVEFDDQFNNVFGLSNSPNDESVAGGDRYRAVMLHNAAATLVSGIKLYLGTLGTSAVSSAGQLSGAGAGTITFPTNGCCDWPHQGWARIETSGGSLRELVYYSARSDSVLTIPSLGRGRLGTSAAAGAATDTVYPVPGLRIGYEAAVPAVSGFVQTIANESTAPNAAAFVGAAWSTAITAGTGIAPASLGFLEQGALWIHRELPADVSAFAKHVNEIMVTFAVGGVPYSEPLTGMFRIAVDGMDRYELYIGTNAEPVIIGGTPNETFPSLPYVTTALFTTGNTYYLVTQKRNKYGMVTESLETTRIEIEGGVVVTNPPSPPTVYRWEATTGGAFILEAVYFYEIDAEEVQADQWLIYSRFDGTNPDPSVDTPTIADLIKTDGAARLFVETAPYAGGTTGKVLVRVRRSVDTSDSTNTDIYTATADATGPSVPAGTVHWRSVAQQS